MMRSAAAFVVASFIAGPSRAQTPAPSLPAVPLPAPLARVLTDYEAAWRSKDAVALAALFTEEGFVLFEYAASRDAMRARMGALLEALSRPR